MFSAIRLHVTVRLASSSRAISLPSLALDFVHRISSSDAIRNKETNLYASICFLFSQISTGKCTLMDRETERGETFLCLCAYSSGNSLGAWCRALAPIRKKKTITTSGGWASTRFPMSSQYTMFEFAHKREEIKRKHQHRRTFRYDGKWEE